eukprot:6706568-Lingulodinium_polyedra.AAC.1
MQSPEKAQLAYPAATGTPQRRPVMTHWLPPARKMLLTPPALSANAELARVQLSVSPGLPRSVT